MMEPVTMTAREGAAHIGCSYWQILEMAKRKEIPCIHIGRRVLFRQSTLDHWMSEQEKQSQKSFAEEPSYGIIRRVKA